MSTYREALFHARSGGEASCGGKRIRFLTREEAEPILLASRPERIVVKGKVKKIAPPDYRLQHLGLYDVGQHPPVEFRPTEEDIASTEWMREGIDDKEPVAPEVVDEILHETLVVHETLGELSERPNVDPRARFIRREPL